MKKENKTETNMLRDMIEYCDKNNIISYYDLKAYAYIERKEWIPLFNSKKNRKLLLAYMHGLKQKKKLKYNRSLQDSFNDYIQAKLDSMEDIY